MRNSQTSYMTYVITYCAHTQCAHTHIYIYIYTHTHYIHICTCHYLVSLLFHCISMQISFDISTNHSWLVLRCRLRGAWWTTSGCQRFRQLLVTCWKFSSMIAHQGDDFDIESLGNLGNLNIESCITQRWISLGRSVSIIPPKIPNIPIEWLNSLCLGFVHCRTGILTRRKRLPECMEPWVWKSKISSSPDDDNVHPPVQLTFLHSQACHSLMALFSVHLSVGEAPFSLVDVPFSWSNPSFCWSQSKFWLIRFHLVGGLEHFLFFPFSWECHHPNWRTHIFRRGRYSTTNQPFFCSVISHLCRIAYESGHRSPEPPRGPRCDLRSLLARAPRRRPLDAGGFWVPPFLVNNGDLMVI